MGKDAKRRARAREKRKQARAQPESPVERARRLAAERACGPCQLCCELMAIPELEKPPRARCSNQCSAGCAIYAARPASCAGFLCLWRQGWGADADRPDLNGIVIDMKLAAEFPALAEAAGGGPYIFSIRTRNDEIAASERTMSVLRSFLAYRNTVTVVSPSRFILYGPSLPNGYILTEEEIRQLEGVHGR